jgi:small nuclear ribonucleoprotein (snRNP)-like protein
VLWALRHKRVRVVVHRGSGVRGIVEGRLQLHDKYMNMVLRDARERYVHVGPPSSTDAATSAPGGGAVVSCWRRRRLELVLIRGECVVSVIAAAPTNPSAPNWPTTVRSRAAFRGRAVLHDIRGDAPASAATAASVPLFTSAIRDDPDCHDDHDDAPRPAARAGEVGWVGEASATAFRGGASGGDEQQWQLEQQQRQQQQPPPPQQQQQQQAEEERQAEDDDARWAAEVHREEWRADDEDEAMDEGEEEGEAEEADDQAAVQEGATLQAEQQQGVFAGWSAAPVHKASAADNPWLLDSDEER